MAEPELQDFKIGRTKLKPACGCEEAPIFLRESKPVLEVSLQKEEPHSTGLVWSCEFVQDTQLSSQNTQGNDLQIITLLLKSSFEFMGMKEKWEQPDFMPMIKDYFASVRRILSSLIKNKTFTILNWVYL